MPVVRSTISFRPKNWKKISSVKNRSKIVNTALDYYFHAQDYLKAREDEFILEELAHYKKTGESFTFAETFADNEEK